MNASNSNPMIGPGTSVLVAGATGGIGSAVADELHRRGADLTLIGLDEQRLGELAVPGPRMALDLRSPDACGQAVALAVAERGRLDVVVNAVGVVAFGSVGELSIDVLEELFLTNTFLPIMLAKAALPHLGDGGTIVNVSGVIAEQNLPGMAAYGASKAALASFDQALAREARRVGVRVIDARPPHTETGLVDRAIAGTAPRLPEGLTPTAVATTIVDAIDSGATGDLPGSAFSAHPAPAGG